MDYKESRYQNEPTSPLKHPRTPEEYKLFFAKQHSVTDAEGQIKIVDQDEVVFESIQQLRTEVEPIDKWRAVKELARDELKDLPDNILEQLQEKFDPFIKVLPRGHGQGHVHRDFLHLATILADPELQTKDPVELIVGIIAGAYHDIGNSVVERYEDNIHAAAHAEVGAYLFGEIAGDSIPVHLTKLIQLAIAAHTKYKQRTVKKTINNETKTYECRPYDTEVVGEDKLGILIARQADRADTQGLPFLARNFLIQGTGPVSNYDTNRMEFYVNENDPVKNLEYQLTPELRSRDYIKQLIDPKQQTQNLLEHLMQFADSNTTETEHSAGDSPYYTDKIIRPNATDLYQFVNRVTQQTASHTPEQQKEAIQDFLIICDIFEPGNDKEMLLPLIKQRFLLLSRGTQDHWYNGLVFAHELHQRWYKRVSEQLNTIDPETAFSFQDPKLKTLTTHVYLLANTVLKQFAPVQKTA